VIAILLARTESHRFAFRREDVDSVMLLPRLRAGPGDIPLIEGWLDFRGHGVPTISLAAVLDLGPEPALVSDHLILTAQSPRVAWRVRRVAGLGEVGWESLELLEHSAQPTPCYVARYQDEGETVHLLNVSGLLLREEQERVRAAQDKRQTRLQQLEAGDV
jgi:chemotaxis signal transduction protein